MEVLNLEPVADRGGGMRTVALFDLQLTPEIRMHGLRLMEAPDGNQFTYAAKCGQRRAATFARPLAEKITAAASLIYKAVTANGTDSEKAA